jgi:hypothetical protein
MLSRRHKTKSPAFLCRNSKLYFCILPSVTVLYLTPGVILCLQLLVVRLMSRGVYCLMSL